jgi:hypothetical protein
VDIFAKGVNFAGYGSIGGVSGDVLEVTADVVQVTAPKGLVVRDSGADGRTYFNLMDSGKLYQQLVAVGAVVRVTEDPAGLFGKSLDAQRAAGLGTATGMFALAVPQQLSAVNIVQSSNLQVAQYLQNGVMAEITANSGLISISLVGAQASSVSTDQSYGIAERLEKAYVLGTPGEQPLISGVQSFSQDNFEYWIDSLNL